MHRMHLPKQNIGRLFFLWAKLLLYGSHRKTFQNKSIQIVFNFKRLISKPLKLNKSIFPTPPPREDRGLSRPGIVTTTMRFSVVI